MNECIAWHGKVFLVQGGMISWLIDWLIGVSFDWLIWFADIMQRRGNMNILYEFIHLSCLSSLQ